MTEQNPFSISELEQQANNGYANAQYHLALRYFEGKGIEQSYEQGMKWLTKSIQANHAEAYQWLENTYLNFVFPYFSGREEINQCYEFAFEWLLNGYEQTPKDFEINFGLAVLYAFDKGLKKNQELAIKHFKACQGECYGSNGIIFSESFAEIFWDFSDFYINISAGTSNDVRPRTRRKKQSPRIRNKTKR